ncbi:MAG TPA: hypothetical protein VLY45_02815 [Nitrospiria bacterium]|nr:hypothetical protein [Nitrospiria bacterium]
MQLRDESMTNKKVKVRVNLSGSRYVGYVSVYAPTLRVSDVLNDAKQFMTLSEVDSIDPVAKDISLVVNKSLIVYVQVIEEPKWTSHGGHTGDFIRVKIRTRGHHIEGDIYVATDMVAEDRAELLNRTPHFLNVRNAEIIGTKERYDFLAISTGQIRSLEIGIQ